MRPGHERASWNRARPGSVARMTEPKTPVEQAVEQALDLLVYAPVGLAVTAAEELPKLIEKGRQRVTGQLTMARMMGEYAVNEGQKRAEQFVRSATGQAGGGGSAEPSPPASREPEDVPSEAARAAAA